MNRQYRVSFVILHYQLFEMTKTCVKCLEDRFQNYCIDIIIVDNASPNGSGRLLQELYKKDELVTVIECPENYGFSKGNNIGFAEAKKRGSHFIIVMNNDVEIHQDDFLEQLFVYYDRCTCQIIGPDIVNTEGIHQSPQRDHYIKKNEIKKWYYKRQFFLKCLYVARKIKPLGFILKRNYTSHDKKRISRFDYADEQMDVELQGACLIFTPEFIKYREYPFEEISFMYGEEPMLGVLCDNNGWHTAYYPTLKVLHKEKSTSRSENRDFISHEIFYTKNMVRGLHNILKRYY